MKEAGTMNTELFAVVPLSEALSAKRIESVAHWQPAGHVVLIVDDERIIADTLSAIFRADGYQVLSAYNGKDGLALAESAHPDLVITDVAMPGLNGVDLAIMVRNLLPQCKILLFSGQASTVDLLSQARSLGYDFETMTKPVHPRDMLSRVARYLEAA
jgi:DNA-binding response OmpR family regulator